MKINIETAYDTTEWKKQKEINKRFIKSVLCDIMCRYKNFETVNNIELSLLFTDDARMKELNLQFRNKNKPTNVLSFPSLAINTSNMLDFKPSSDYIYLGDIAFGYNVINNESRERDICFFDHFVHLLIHSILHLLGFTHDNEQDAKIMESLEIEILKHFAIKSPY